MIGVVRHFGNSTDKDEIMVVSKENNLKVIEECTRAPGALYKGQLVGKMGDIGTLLPYVWKLRL